ncbi:hypothetical protein PENTCL1PPCAC_18793, partial [Pristionchus entomophagus]
ASGEVLREGRSGRYPTEMIIEGLTHDGMVQLSLSSLQQLHSTLRTPHAETCTVQWNAPSPLSISRSSDGQAFSRCARSINQVIFEEIITK